MVRSARRLFWGRRFLDGHFFPVAPPPRQAAACGGRVLIADPPTLGPRGGGRAGRGDRWCFRGGSRDGIARGRLQQSDEDRCQHPATLHKQGRAKR